MNILVEESETNSTSVINRGTRINSSYSASRIICSMTSQSSQYWTATVSRIIVCILSVYSHRSHTLILIDMRCSVRTRKIMMHIEVEKTMK